MKKAAAKKKKAAAKAKALPWSDCKVAFGYDSDDDDGDDKAVWDKWGPKHGRDQSGSGQYKLPQGWSLDETDGAGARVVVVFRVEGPLRRRDGEKVARLLSILEGASS